MNPLNQFQPPPIPGEKSTGLTKTKARNYALMNQLATPGLGSLMGGRWVAGGGQLALAVIGFGLLLFWFFKVMSGYYGMINDQHSEPQANGAWGLAGAAVFAASWMWSLVTSISLLREGSRKG